MIHTAGWQEIKEGKVTDVYFARTLQILRAKGIDKRVRAELIAKELPQGWAWAVLAGMEECLSLMEGVKVHVRGMAEGTIFRPYQPVLEVEGNYTDFCLYETALLGFLCQASGIATKAARCKKAAGNRMVISFGARRMHPSLAPMIERNAYIGGCDGVAVVASGRLIEQDPMGTMPHALIILLGDTVGAIQAFHEVIPGEVRRVALIDTFNDEKFEALRVAEALGKELAAIRLDTPRSRRGDFYRIFEEVRWELDLRGYQHVKLYASGALDEEDIHRLNPLVDAYGVGTTISNAPVVDFSMDIVEVEGQPLAKRGKWSGAKSVWRCRQCHQDQILPRGWPPEGCPCGGEREELVQPLVQDGQLLHSFPLARQLREKVLQQLELEAFPL
ncbi:MAG: nicotinate phosphoribosyltransferase [Nitrospinae bacterium]|nr:nicotinate phosphoribosyltransferase [Nitrospinota bacterium]